MAMTREEFLKSSGLKVTVLELWIEQEWLVPEKTPSGPVFREIDHEIEEPAPTSVDERIPELVG